MHNEIKKCPILNNIITSNMQLIGPKNLMNIFEIAFIIF